MDTTVLQAAASTFVQHVYRKLVQSIWTPHPKATGSLARSLLETGEPSKNVSRGGGDGDTRSVCAFLNAFFPLRLKQANLSRLAIVLASVAFSSELRREKRHVGGVHQRLAIAHHALPQFQTTTKRAVSKHVL